MSWEVLAGHRRVERGTLSRVWRSWTGHTKELTRRSCWGVADQALISGTNFVTMVLVARNLTPAAFGSFTLAYTALLLANSVQSALITQPHNVLGAVRRGKQYQDYTASTATGQLLFLVMVLLPSSAAAVIARLAGWSEASLLIALVPAIAAWQLQEFLRRVLYTEQRLGAAFANDVISYGGQTVIVAALWAADALSGEVALYALAATSFVAAGVGAWQLHHSFGEAWDLSALGPNWRFGKWLGGQEIVGYWLSSQAYLYLAALILGTPAAATLKVVQVLFGPLRVVTFSLDTMLPISLARGLVVEGQPAVRRQLRRACTLIMPLIGAYCLFAAIFAGPLLQLIYGRNYTGSAAVLVLYAAYALLSSWQLIISSALRARQLTGHVFASTAYASLIPLLLGWPMVKALDVEGAVIGMILTAMTASILFWRAYRRGSAEGA